MSTVIQSHGQFVSNTTPSLPIEQNVDIDVDMEGFAFSVIQGIFIPLHGGVDYFDTPLPYNGGV